MIHWGNLISNSLMSLDHSWDFFTEVSYIDFHDLWISPHIIDSPDFLSDERL